MLVYRITHKNYADRLTASGVDGRWTSGGRMVVYCASSIALAFLENMIRRQGIGFNDDFKTVVVEIPDTLDCQVITPDTLSSGWRDTVNYDLCRIHGNKWYDERKSPILKVPSAVVQSSDNYVLNTNHHDFAKINIVAITTLLPDERIEVLLKHNNKGISDR